jgi:hypothetical protein
MEARTLDLILFETPVDRGGEGRDIFVRPRVGDARVREGVDAAGSTLLDKLYLPQAARRLVRGLEGSFEPVRGSSVAIVETHTVAAALTAADTALKSAEVVLTQLQLAKGIGGKGYFVLAGSLHMVEAALEAVAGALEPTMLVATELIQQPHRDLDGTVL